VVCRGFIMTASSNEAEGVRLKNLTSRECEERPNVVSYVFFAGERVSELCVVLA